MRNLILSLSIIILFISCNNTSTKEYNLLKNTKELIDISKYQNFGEEFEISKIISTEEMRKSYQTMEIGDSLEVIFKAKVKSICQKKGCWMTLDLGDDNSESFVKFKNYEFFVPMDAIDSDAVVKGMAYKNETSVQDLKHYAEDAGKLQEEINSIVEPKIEYTFIADGVYLKKSESES